MDEYFQKGKMLQVSLGHPVSINRFLGEGGQDTVCETDYDGVPKTSK